jgi:hypothetical protein
MSKEGTQFMATGIYTKYVVDQLRVNGERGLLKMIFSVFAALLGGVIPPPVPYASEPSTPPDECCASHNHRSQFNQSTAGNFGGQFFPEIEGGGTLVPVEITDQIETAETAHAPGDLHATEDEMC